MGKTIKNLFFINTNICVEITVLDICFKKRTKESVAEICENIFTVGGYY